MKKLKLKQNWLNELLPEGLPYPSSTLISGPGGSGKPLIGFAFVSDWLEAGGNVVFIPLQYPRMELVKTSLQQLYHFNIGKYLRQVAFIQFNPDLDRQKKVDEKTIEANILKSDVWDKVINEIENLLSDECHLGTLIFASALNLLLFSPTYNKLNSDKFERIIREDKSRTYILSVSTSAFKKDIEKWEKAADNLMFARMEKPMKLYLRITKIENREISSKEIQVPMNKGMLENIKEVAESTRKREIPKLRKI